MRLFCCLLLLSGFAAAAEPAATAAYQEFVQGKEALYRELLARQDAAVAAAPDDAAVAVARCNFIAHFSDGEDGEWIDTAEADLQACAQALKQRWPDASAARVYEFQQMYGDIALTFGETLLAQSSDWSIDLRRQLAADLSRKYEFDGQKQRAGKLAVAAVELGDVSRVADAVKYLADTNDQSTALELLRNAAPADNAWAAQQRVTAALELDDTAAAATELQRYDVQWFAPPSLPSAKAWLRDGKPDRASATLGAASSKEAEATKLVRFDVAMATGDVAAAAATVTVSPTDFAANAQRFAVLANADPASILLPGMRGMAVLLVLVVVLLALLPGVLLLPVHYRGLIRRFGGKLALPMFQHVGLRAAWVALALLLIVPFCIIGLVEPQSLAASLDGESLPQQAALFRSVLWSSCISLLLLSPWLLRMGADVIGDVATWRGSWRIVVAWLFLLVISYGIVWLQPESANTSTLQTKAVQSLITGGIAEYGVPVAFVLLVLLVPALEELTFRGLLLGGMSRHISFGWANLIQAVLFALIHNDTPRFAFYLALGLLAGWLVRKTRALAPAFVLHAVNNALAFWVSVVAR